MNPSRWRRVNELFHEAAELDPGARDAFLEQATQDDPDLRREVQSLLDSHERAPGYLDRPAWEAAPDLVLDPPESLVGRQVGAYRVIAELGRGGMGVVYAARDERLGRDVALKALPAEYAHDPVRRARLTREARAAAALSHPAIATIFALDEIDGGLYITSELVRGSTLREELHRGPLPPDRLLDTLTAIASALAAAHARRIVHRDLKPENVMRDRDGRIKVLDFGIARFALQGDETTMTRLTEAGNALGTPGYMAPEQLQGDTVDMRSDIFAFGVLGWELATGSHPFGTDPATLLARMTELIEGRTAGLRGPLPVAGLADVLRRCMRAAPGDRYPSAQALLDDLHALPTGVGTPGRSMPAGGPLWWWQFHQVALAVLAGTTPVLAWLVRDWAGRPRASWGFLAILALATTAVTLRLNLLFTARVHPDSLRPHRARVFPFLAALEGAIAVGMAAFAVAIAGAHDGFAAAFVAIAVVLAASLAFIEPATTRAAGLGSRRA